MAFNATNQCTGRRVDKGFVSAEMPGTSNIIQAKWPANGQTPTQLTNVPCNVGRHFPRERRNFTCERNVNSPQCNGDPEMFLGMFFRLSRSTFAPTIQMKQCAVAPSKTKGSEQGVSMCNGCYDVRRLPSPSTLERLPSRRELLPDGKQNTQGEGWSIQSVMMAPP